MRERKGEREEREKVEQDGNFGVCFSRLLFSKFFVSICCGYHRAAPVPGLKAAIFDLACPCGQRTTVLSDTLKDSVLESFSTSSRVPACFLRRWVSVLANVDPRDVPVVELMRKVCITVIPTLCFLDGLRMGSRLFGMVEPVFCLGTKRGMVGNDEWSWWYVGGSGF